MCSKLCSDGTGAWIGLEGFYRTIVVALGGVGVVVSFNVANLCEFWRESFLVVPT